MDHRVYRNAALNHSIVNELCCWYLCK